MIMTIFMVMYGITLFAGTLASLQKTPKLFNSICFIIFNISAMAMSLYGVHHLDAVDKYNKIKNLAISTEQYLELGDICVKDLNKAKVFVPLYENDSKITQEEYLTIKGTK